MKATRQASSRAALLQTPIMAFLLLVALAFASETNSYDTPDTLGLSPQAATTPSLITPIQTITLDILQPPYVSLRTLTARDAKATPTSSLEPSTFVQFDATGETSSLESLAPITTVAMTNSKGETLDVTWGLETTTVSLALHLWTAVPVASSANSFSRAVDLAQTQWDCTAICGELNGDGECSNVVGCVDLGQKVKGGKPVNYTGGAGSLKSSGRCGVGILAFVLLAVGVWMLL